MLNVCMPSMAIIPLLCYRFFDTDVMYRLKINSVCHRGSHITAPSRSLSKSVFPLRGKMFKRNLFKHFYPVSVAVFSFSEKKYGLEHGYKCV